MRAVQKLEDNIAGGLPQCPHLLKGLQNLVNHHLARWNCVFAQDEENFGLTKQFPTGSATSFCTG